MSAVRSARLEAAGVSSPLIEAGPPDAAEAIVFVHGNPGSSTDWTSLVESAGEVGRAVAFDMPGFGAARAPSGFGYDIASYAAFVDAALRELGIERAHLVLHDFGGPFGLFWGIAHPDQWASVVLINIGVMPGYSWHSMAKRWRTPVLGELVQAWIPRWGWRRTMQKSGPRGLPERFVDKMYDDYDRDTRQTVLKLYRATPDPGETAAELGAALARWRSRRWSCGGPPTPSSTCSSPSASGSSSTSRTWWCSSRAATGPSRTTRSRSSGRSCRSCVASSA